MGTGAPGRSAAAGEGRLPQFFQYDAPADWRAIDFISDLHLAESMPRTFAAWARHLRSTSADAVIILGDLFEVWVGDDARQRPFERLCVEVLADTATRRVVAFMPGNRDFLVGHAMTLACGLTSLPDPTRLQAWGQSVVLTHGDALCLDDAPYQQFRQEVRSPEWQSRFLARPLDERIEIAAEMRRQSQGRRRFDGDAHADIDAAQAVMWMHALGSAELVHGHTHRPGSAALAPGFKRHVLSDWDLDHGQRAEVVRLTRHGFERLPPAGL